MKQQRGYFRSPHHASFRLVDLTGDGNLDIWVEFSNVVFVISFQNDEFKVLFSSYKNNFYLARPAVDRYMHTEFLDLDKDGIYEIKIPCKVPSIFTRGWINLYEWDGTDFILNNSKYYSVNDEFLSDWLRTYNHYRTTKEERFNDLFETCNFYIGLMYYYRDNIPSAQKHLQWIIANSKKDEYIQTAKSILKKAQKDKKGID